MKTTTIHPRALQTNLLWLAVPALILLTAGYAVVLRTPVPPASQAALPPKPPPAEPLIPVVAEPPVSRPAADPEPVAAAVASKTSECETAEVELPDICPNNACRQLKTKCGLPSH
jgi:hypothetical protein